MLDVGKLGRMAKHKKVKHPLDPAIARANDALSRELREAARFLIDLYLWRKRAEATNQKSKVDE
jgi:hypothetical protein